MISTVLEDPEHQKDHEDDHDSDDDSVCVHGVEGTTRRAVGREGARERPPVRVTGVRGSSGV
jgi:hypothetical protein